MIDNWPIYAEKAGLQNEAVIFLIPRRLAIPPFTGGLLAPCSQKTLPRLMHFVAPRLPILTNARPLHSPPDWVRHAPQPESAL